MTAALTMKKPLFARVIHAAIRFFELDFAFRKWHSAPVTVLSISSRKFTAPCFGSNFAPSSAGRELTAFDIVLDTPAGRTEVVEFDCEHLNAGDTATALYRTSRWIEPEIEVKMGSLR